MSRRPPKKSAIIHMRASHHDIAAIDAEARRLNLTRTDAINLAITEWLAQIHKDTARKGKAHE